MVVERLDGMCAYDSIMRVCHLGFGPIMMTTFAALFVALSLALTHGSGSELCIPLGVSVLGGLLLWQLLPLYTTSVIYLALERLRLKLHRDAQEVEARETAMAPALASEPGAAPQEAEE